MSRRKDDLDQHTLNNHKSPLGTVSSAVSEPLLPIVTSQANRTAKYMLLAVYPNFVSSKTELACVPINALMPSNANLLYEMGYKPMTHASPVPLESSYLRYTLVPRRALRFAVFNSPVPPLRSYQGEGLLRSFQFARTTTSLV